MRELDENELSCIVGGNIATVCSAIAGFTIGSLAYGNLGFAAIGGGAFILLCVKG